MIEHVYAWLLELSLVFCIGTGLSALDLGHNGIKSRGISKSDITEHFSVKANVGLFTATDKFAVAQPTLFAGSV
jgi:hypothetical protein